MMSAHLFFLSFAHSQQLIRSSGRIGVNVGVIDLSIKVCIASRFQIRMTMGSALTAKLPLVASQTIGSVCTLLLLEARTTISRTTSSNSLVRMVTSPLFETAIEFRQFHSSLNPSHFKGL